jgi:GGDEF domain-containing protein
MVAAVARGLLPATLGSRYPRLGRVDGSLGAPRTPGIWAWLVHRELVDLLQTVGKDPARLIFEDELTGLNNRRFLRGFFEHKVDWDGNADFPLSLLMLDLDHYKQINDTHGHEAGDQVLLWLFVADARHQ